VLAASLREELRAAAADPHALTAHLMVSPQRDGYVGLIVWRRLPSGAPSRWWAGSRPPEDLVELLAEYQRRCNVGQVP
jgi:hypothetical protein